MRDEIRLTRIMIQYCDTKDGAVLKELKKWFDEMNEIQRTVMAKSLRDRAIACRGPVDAVHPYSAVDPYTTVASRGAEDLLNPFCDIYKTIHEYDVVPLTPNWEKYLTDLGLIE